MTSEPHIFHVLPIFPDKPALWFAQLESQFMLAGITNDTHKFCHTIAQLEQQYAVEIADVIISPPTTGKYERLKTELIKRLSVVQDNKVKQLLTHEELGDRTPSQFLSHLQNLTGSSVSDDFLRTIWTSRLPQGIQTIIATLPISMLEDLTELADRIYDVIIPKKQVASTSSGHSQVPSPESNDNIAALERQVAALTEQVRVLSVQVRQSRPTQRHRSKSRQRYRSRSQSNYRKYPECWYHKQFGSEARRCVKPCDYPRDAVSQ